MHVHMQNNSLLEIHLQIGGYMLNVLELLPLRGWEREWEIREKKQSVNNVRAQTCLDA